MSALQSAPMPPSTAAPPPQPEKLFTLAQIQAAGGFSRSTLFRLRHTVGGLRVVSVGGVCRVRESDWQAWLDKHATGNGDNETNQPEKNL